MVAPLKFAALVGAVSLFLLGTPSTSDASSFGTVCLVSPGATDCPSGVPTLTGMSEGVEFSVALFMDDAVDVGDFLIDGLTWSPAELSLVSATDGGFLGACALAPCFQFDDTAPGTLSFISFFDFGAAHAVTGSGNLALLTFLPLTSGMAAIDFIGSVLVTDLATLDTISGVGQGAQVAVAAAPEPATLLLVGTGVVGVVMRRRARRHCVC